MGDWKTGGEIEEDGATKWCSDRDRKMESGCDIWETERVE